MRDVWGAADGSGEHDMLGPQRARHAFARNARGPARRGVVITRAFKGRAGPEADVEDIDIMLEPVRDLVLRNVVREGEGEGQIAQVIDRRLVVQLQPAIAQPPIVAMRSSRSTISAESPIRFNSTAAEMPVWPPPTMSTS